MTTVFLFLYSLIFLFPAYNVLIFYLPKNLNDLEKTYSIYVYVSPSVLLKLNYRKGNDFCRCGVPFGVVFFLDMKNELLSASSFFSQLRRTMKI